MRLFEVGILFVPIFLFSINIPHSYQIHLCIYDAMLSQYQVGGLMGILAYLKVVELQCTVSNTDSSLIWKSLEMIDLLIRLTALRIFVIMFYEEVSWNVLLSEIKCILDQLEKIEIFMTLVMLLNISKVIFCVWIKLLKSLHSSYEMDLVHVLRKVKLIILVLLFRLQSDTRLL